MYICPSQMVTSTVASLTSLSVSSTCIRTSSTAPSASSGVGRLLASVAESLGSLPLRHGSAKQSKISWKSVTVHRSGRTLLQTTPLSPCDPAANVVAQVILLDPNSSAIDDAIVRLYRLLGGDDGTISDPNSSALHSCPVRDPGGKDWIDAQTTRLEVISAARAPDGITQVGGEDSYERSAGQVRPIKNPILRSTDPCLTAECQCLFVGVGSNGCGEVQRRSLGLHPGGGTGQHLRRFSAPSAPRKRRRCLSRHRFLSVVDCWIHHSRHSAFAVLSHCRDHPGHPP